MAGSWATTVPFPEDDGSGGSAFPARNITFHSRAGRAIEESSTVARRQRCSVSTDDGPSQSMMSLVFPSSCTTAGHDTSPNEQQPGGVTWMHDLFGHRQTRKHE